jgi:hypothetical protein
MQPVLFQIQLCTVATLQLLGWFIVHHGNIRVPSNPMDLDQSSNLDPPEGIIDVSNRLTVFGLVVIIYGANSDISQYDKLSAIVPGPPPPHFNFVPRSYR